MRYEFKDDDGNIHLLSFSQMMEAKDGFYQKEDGTWLREFVTQRFKRQRL